MSATGIACGGDHSGFPDTAQCSATVQLSEDPTGRVSAGDYGISPKFRILADRAFSISPSFTHQEEVSV